MLAFQILPTQLNEGSVTVADIERLRAVKYVGALVIDKMTLIFFRRRSFSRASLCSLKFLIFYKFTPPESIPSIQARSRSSRAQNGVESGGAHAQSTPTTRAPEPSAALTTATTQQHWARLTTHTLHSMSMPMLPLTL